MLLIAFTAFLATMAPSHAAVIFKAGGMKMITADSDPALYSRATDVAMMMKDDVLSAINDHSFALKGDNTIYPFKLVECGLQVCFLCIILLSR